MSEGDQIDDSKNEDAPGDESSQVQQEEPEEKIRKRDYIDIRSHPNVMKLLYKQGWSFPVINLTFFFQNKK